MILKVDYNGDFEIKFKPALSYESGDQVGLIYETPEVENLVRLTL